MTVNSHAGYTTPQIRCAARKQADWNDWLANHIKDVPSHKNDYHTATIEANHGVDVDSDDNGTDADDDDVDMSEAGRSDLEEEPADGAAV